MQQVLDVDVGACRTTRLMFEVATRSHRSVIMAENEERFRYQMWMGEEVTLIYLGNWCRGYTGKEGESAEVIHLFERDHPVTLERAGQSQVHSIPTNSISGP